MTTRKVPILTRDGSRVVKQAVATVFVALLFVRSTHAGGPPNDLCRECEAIGEGSFSGTTSGANNDGSASCGNSKNNLDVWYCYTAGCTGTATANTCRSDTNFDTVLSVHSGCPGEIGNEIVCNDDDCDLDPFHSTVTWDVARGTTYLIRVSGFGNENGSFELNVDCDCDPPCEFPFDDVLGGWRVCEDGEACAISLGPGPPWLKHFLDPMGPNGLPQQGDTFVIEEHLVIAGSDPWADWHEEITTPEWVWTQGTLDADGIQVAEGTLAGAIIWFDFPAQNPGTAITITKTMEYTGSGDFMGGQVDVEEFPTGITDCNGNGIHDADEIAAGTSQDCNGNQIPDECDVAGGTSQDCNGNDVPDKCDVYSVVYFEDFESGVVGPEWDLTDTDSSVGVFTTFSGIFGSSNEDCEPMDVQKLTWDVGGPGTGLLSFDLDLIDSWDGDDGPENDCVDGGVHGPDYFVISVGGVEVFRETFNQLDQICQSFPGSPHVGPEFFGWTEMHKDSIYRHIEVPFTAFTSVVEIRFESDTTNGCKSDEAWGIDNVQIAMAADHDQDGIPNECENCCDTPALCDGDANGDGAVDPLDSGYVLARFGLDVNLPGNCQADVNCDGAIDPLDSGYVLARFGVCNPVPECPPGCVDAVEGCCFGDGSCSDLDPATCADQGGESQGGGTDCAGVDCGGGVTEACCFIDGTCQDLDPAACIDAGGGNQGKGTSCAGGGCKGSSCPDGADGDCCDPAGNGTPGCDDPECCALVCDIDPFCCDTAWDSICAGEAAELCDLCAP